MIAHLSGLLGIVAAQLALVWSDKGTDLAGKIAISAITLLTVLLTDTSKQERAKVILRAGAAIGAIVVAIVVTRCSASSGAAAVLTTLAAVFVRLQALLPPPKLPQPSSDTPVINGPGAAAVTLLAGSLLLAGPARADISLDDIVPRLTKCWGSTCITPAAAVDAALFDLDAKKWQAGVTNLGGGVALLFAADSPWASGISARVTGVLSQSGPSFAMPSIGVVLARYVEVAYSRRFAEGPDTNYLSLAGVVPFDLFTAATIPERARAARASQGDTK